jgi:hypothetical protein
MRPRTAIFLFLLPFLVSAQAQNPDQAGLQPNPAAAVPAAPPLVACPAGAPLGPVDLQVQSGDQKLPFRGINRLSEGDTLLYAPVLQGKEKRRGEVALVLVPQKRVPGRPDIIVTDPEDAGKPHQWKMTETISLAALVYGPSGLNRNKVSRFLSQDELLVAQLADYADRTAEAQQLVATLSNRESSAASVNAALSGFASRYGFAIQVDRNASAAAQAQTVFASMNPQLAAYNPLASSIAQGVGQTASLATMAGSLFFGSPVGLAAGGAAMLLDLRAITFPDTQFRAAFAQPLAHSASGLNVCGQQGPVPPHTRVAYVWASRVPNTPPPTIRIGEPSFIPAAQKTDVPVDVPEPAWKYLDRVREWALVDGANRQTAIGVVKLGNQKALELDLTKASLPPGDYRLAGLWDWTPARVEGVVHVRPLSDFRQARLDPVSQDRLLAGSGNQTVRVDGSDFEFATKVEIQKKNDEFAATEPIRFALPQGPRHGPQDHMDVRIATQSLEAGAYELLITQQDGKTHPVGFKVLPNPPHIANLPVLLNLGAAPQHFVLKGDRLGLIARLEAEGVVFTLNPAVPNQSERSLTAELKSAPRPGTRLTVRAYVQDRSEPITLPEALEITGPLPVIASVKLSRAAGQAIAPRADELPAGSTLNALLDVKNMERTSVLQLGCAEGIGAKALLSIGARTARWSLQQLSPDQLFLAFDSSELPAGCSLEAVVDNGREGKSRPFSLARLVRLPKIDSFSAAPDRLSGLRQYQLTGENLEMIQKIGWTENDPVEVTGLPAPLPGPGLKQALELGLPDPPKSGAALWIWLRGDRDPRAATIPVPDLPAHTAAPQSEPAPRALAATPAERPKGQEQ